jgi:peptidoglycan/xylan/chitin deacetylase (PgdA/CDA1 family)
MSRYPGQGLVSAHHPKRVVRMVLRSFASSVLEAVHSNEAPRILYYHRIHEDDHRSCVHPRQFYKQMDYLAAHDYQVLTLEDLSRRIQAHQELPGRSVVLTLDDGFLDNYTHAFPILRQFGFPATIFLTVGFIGAAELPVLSGPHRPAPPLAWEQVCEMAEFGISFGSHTLTHPSLPRLWEAEVKREVHVSRLLLEDKLRRGVRFFCYPKGEFTPAVKAVVRGAGYEAACSVLPGPVLATSDLYALPRTYISRDDTVTDFRKKLHGAWDVLHAAAQRRAQLRKWWSR